MEIYEISIAPKSAFGTSLKGDTLFGHFCWQAAYDASLLDGGLDVWIDRYKSEPFAVFSSAWPRLRGEIPGYAVKRPDLPLSFFPQIQGKQMREFMEARKEIRRQKWMVVPESLSFSLRSTEFLTDAELAQKIRAGAPSQGPILDGRDGLIFEMEQPHNSINRLTMTTGQNFAPFEENCRFYAPGCELAVFALLNRRATDIERVVSAFERVGRFGFGKNASTGLGRFEISAWRQIALPSDPEANACYALSPFLPEAEQWEHCWFTVFVRYGKHGDVWARSANPFKNPVVMAEEGAVLEAPGPETFRKPFIGSAVFGLSKTFERTAAQGYSAYVPFRLEK